MKKGLLLLTILCVSLFSEAQVYFLNEDFSTANAGTPPAGWTIERTGGLATDSWKFNNPGGRTVSFPVIGNFTIFDSQRESPTGGAEKVSLVSPFVDCSFSQQILLYFDHQFVGGRQGKGTVEVFDGSNWVASQVYTDSTNGIESAVLNISALAGGKSNARFRFTWEGDSSYYWLVDNVKIFAPLTRDAGIRAIETPTMPFNSGVNPIRVSIVNEGVENLTSATVKWTVDGVAQTPYSWTGSLALGQAASSLQIGTYNFPSGLLKNVKVWVENPNGQADLNRLNDTLQRRLAAQLCGNYTIGGSNPDFVNFGDAVAALNAAGVGCPVVFKVRDGVYDEQVKIFEVLGSSAVNTIRFEGESGDSSKAVLHYQQSNPANDFTLSLSGTDYVGFSKLGIRRSNGSGNMVIQNGSHHVSVENCWLGNVSSPGSSVDSMLVFKGNAMRDADLIIDQVGGSKAKGILIEGNVIRLIQVNNSYDVQIRLNEIAAIQCTGDTLVFISGNKNFLTYDYFDRRNLGIVFVQSCLDVSVNNNQFAISNIYVDAVVSIYSSRLLDIVENSILVDNQNPTRGIYLASSITSSVTKNNIVTRRSSVELWDCSDTDISENTMRGTPSNETWDEWHGITLRGYTQGILDSSSRYRDSTRIFGNRISGFQNRGIMIDRYNYSYSNQYSFYLEISKNDIDSIGTDGIRIFLNYPGISEENNIFLVSGNRIKGVKNGSGILLSSGGGKVSNNYIQGIGRGVAKGIVLSATDTLTGFGSKIFHNSVHIASADIENGRALEVLGGRGHVIKNNIFANSGGGYAAYINALPTNKDWDYNNYYSSSENRFGYIGGQNFNNLGSWGAVLGGDANSKNLNPVFASDTLLQPYEKRLNGAGIGVVDVPLDIDGEIRNQQAPDIGAQEFMVDFGITRVVSPENNCPQGVNSPIKVALRQYGDVPFIDLKLAYQINGGAIVYDTVPGTITNDIEYTFDQKSILSTTGDNIFKVWLVDNADDNTVNDTLVNVIKIGETFNPLPASLRLETGQTIELDGGTGHSSYLWSTGDTTRKITVNQLGTYSVKVNVNTICEVADTVVVTNCVVSGYNPFADTTSLCAKTAQLDAGSGYLVYNWSNTQSTQQITVTQSGWYKVTVTNEFGCLGSDSTYFSLINAEIIQSDTTICLNVSKSLAVDPIKGTSILWSTGDTTSSITVTPAQTTTYTVTVTDGITSCTDQVTVTVVPVDTSVTALDALAICPGTSTHLQAGNGSSYKWLRDGVVILGATSKEYAASIAGDYRVVVTNANGCSDTSRAIRVTVKDNPMAGSWNTVAPVCSGTNTSTLQISGNVGTLRWQYSTNGTTYVDMAGLTDSTYQATNLTSTMYYRVIASNSCGSDTSAVQTVVVNPTPAVSFTVNNATQSLSGNLFTFTNTTPETTGDTYVWALGNGFTVTTRNTSFSYTLPGTYSVSLTVRTALGCESTTQQVIEVVDLPEAGQITGSATVCGDVNSNALSVTGSSGTLQWQQSANNISFSNINSVTSSSYTATNLSATTYYRVIASKNGLFDTSAVATITVNPKPAVSFTVNNASQMLTGNSFVFTNTSTGGSTYLWKFGNGVTATTQNATYSYATAGSYVVRLVVTSALGCQDSTSTTVTVTAPQPPVAGQITGSAAVCGPINSNTLSVAGSSGTLQWQQSANNISFSNINSATSSSYTATNLSATTYFRVIASRAGLTDTSGVATITFNPTPEASFSINDSTQTIDGNQFVFTNTSNAVSGSTFLWDLGDGFYTSNRSVTYTYQSSGIFDVKLHVETGAGCSSDFIRRVYVIEAPVARDDQFTVDEDNVLTGNAALNDRQSNDGGNNWTLLGANGGALNGTVVMQSNGLFTYTPKSNYNGLELFKYKLCDVNGDCDTANVLITVNLVDDFPLAFQDVFNTAHATTLTGSVSLNDTASADGGNVWSLVQFNGGSKGGTISMATTGLFSYTPRQGYSGTDSIRYQLCDVDGDCVQAYLLITVAAGSPPPPPPPPPPVAAGNLYAAGTTCAQFNARTGTTLNRLCYTVSSGRVSAVTPSSFMYYVKVTAPSASFTVNISQTVSRTGFRLFTVNTGGSVVSGDNCARVTSVSSPSTGQARASVTRATVGRTYIIGVRYDTRSLVGYSTNGTLSANYTFVARIGNTTLPNSNSTVTLYPNNCVGVSGGQLARLPELGGLPGASAGVDKTGSETRLAIRVYPNPSNSRFNVLIEGSDRQTKGVLRIMNAQGQVVEEIKDVKPGTELQLGVKYISGTYTAVFIQGNQTTRQRMVKY